jgi:copper(I)-binding protein
MIAHDPAPALRGPAAGQTQPRRDAPRQLLKAALAPVICALVLLGVLSGWVATGGAGTISRVRIEISSASVVITTASGSRAVTYLVLVNLGSADELLSAASPGVRRIQLVQHNGSAAGPGHILHRLAIPAHATLTLSPFGSDIVLTGPAQLMPGRTVPLTLTFRNAGQVTVQAAVAPPGML